MGNRIGKCFEGAGEVSRRHDIAAAVSGTLDEGLGHSFCYIRPGGSDQLPSSMVHSEESNSQTTTFRSISGASVSANTSTPLSTSLIDLYAHGNAVDKASTFNSSISFASIPLQPVPRNSNFSADFPGSGPMERGFLSGPIERGILSGPIDRGILSGPIERDLFSERARDQLQRSSFSGFGAKSKLKNRSLGKSFKRAIMKVFSKRAKGTVWNREIEWVREKEKSSESNIFSSENTTNLSSGGSLSNDVDEDDFSMESHNLQWAHGKAGEDRVHIVVSEEFGWVFVGIYDGFNGPDAPDFLLSHLYSNVHKELKGLLWNDKLESEMTHFGKGNSSLTRECGYEFHHFGIHCGHEREAKTPKNQSKGAGRKWEQNQKRWRCEWDRERLELDRRLKEQMGRSSSGNGSGISHSDIMKALSQALRKTEEAYLEIADKMVMENPELLLMGSCALVMLMKGEDVYLMNVGDSRAVLAQKPEPDLGFGKATHDLEFLNEETLNNLESIDGRLPSLCSLQLTMDHSTYVEEEVERIRNEHSNDASAIMNDRVKGYLKVTRAFGAGFLKQPKWNDALLEMFRIDYVGTSPYITCSPSLHHHRLNPRDAFLILSSDGLYQYFTNQEAISEVELFMSSSPEGDPAQHLIEEVLFRAAKKAGMDFHELLDIPQGDRRRYHDDVSVIIISLEGRIWRSSV